jgi:dolichol-phosphate mannosyltransferase
MSAFKCQVSVVLPTYNESENMPMIIPKICSVLKDAGIRGEVIVVDDNSPDGTAEAARKLAETFPVRVVVRTEDRGLATAVIAGFNLSEAQVCVVMDADGSHPVEKLPEMIRPILDDRADITVGSRHVTEGGIGHWPLHRRIVSKAAALMTLGLTKMSDPTSGFMAIRRTFLRGLELNPVGWKIVLEIVVKARTDRLIEVPFTFNDRELGESKMSLKEQWNYIRHLCRLYKFRMPTLAEFIRFCIVGFSGVFVDMGIVIGVKTLFALDTRLCAVFGFMAAMSTNYLFHRRWSFEGARATPVVRSYLIFVAVCCVGLAGRMGVMHILIEYADLDGGYRYILTNFIGIVAGTLVNYTGSRFFAFSPDRLAFGRKK